MENNEDKKKSILGTIATVLLLIVISLCGWLLYDKYFSNNNSGNNSNNGSNNTNAINNYYQKSEVYLAKKSSDKLPMYMNFDGTESERITEEELRSRLKKYTHTCGFKDIEDESADNCVDQGTDYIIYLIDGVPYTVHTAMKCEEEGCEEVEGYYDVVKYTFINNVKKVISRYNQYSYIDIGAGFAFELESGDVYYFVPLDEYKTIDGKEMTAHLVKVTLASKLKGFSNVEDGQISYGTDIVVELENGEKYVLEYNQNTNKLNLTKYDDYNKANHEFDDSVELSEDEEVIKVSSDVLKSEKLNNIINNNKFISDNSSKQEYDGICPEITVKVDSETLHFHVLQIANTKVFLYTDNDNSDGRMIEVYGLHEDSLYYARFFAVDYEDPENHSLTLQKYDVANIESIALITIKDESNMLTNDDVPATPENYAIFKTKDGKYYTDYSLDKDSKVLRQVVQNSNESNISTVNGVKLEYIEKVNSKTLKVSSGNEKINLNDLEFISTKNYTDRELTNSFFNKDMIEDFEEYELFAKNNNIQFVISSSQFGRETKSDFTILKLNNVGTPKVITSYYMASDDALIFLYVLNTNNELYRCTFNYHTGKSIDVAKLDIKNVEGITITDDVVDEEIEVGMPGTEYIIIKTKNGKYYKDYTYNGNKLIEVTNSVK